MCKYKRILLKLSGEALASTNNIIDIAILNKIVVIVKSVLKQNIQLALVVGGGNILRGAQYNHNSTSRINADKMGMLATVINALAIADRLNKENIDTTIMSAFAIFGGICETFNNEKAKKILTAGKVVIFSAGTGNPCFTTDTAAALRGIEINADIIFKATKVDGVYDKDPIKNPDAFFYKKLSFDEIIEKKLKIMDATAFTLCQKYNLKICIFNMLANTNTLADILNNKQLGTMIS